MKTTTKVILAGAMTLLAACGAREPGRVQGGAATGAATGATVGLVGGPVGVAAGAVIGGGAGAIALVHGSGACEVSRLGSFISGPGQRPACRGPSSG
jgi:hypothetical protein